MKLWSKVQFLFRKDKLDAEMAEEMRLHLELQTKRNVAAGMNARDAHYAAQRQFGGMEQVKEQCRDQRSWVWLDQFIQDLRYGSRMLGRNRGFTAIVALTLAVGIGLNTVVFSVYGAVVLKPLAVRDPQRIIRVVTVQRDRWSETFSYSEFKDLSSRAECFSSVIATSPQHIVQVIKPNVKADASETFGVRLVSENYFSGLGVLPALGRMLVATDSYAGVLSYEAWQRRFHGDPAVVGQVLRVQNLAVTIVGVAAKSFAGTGLTAAVPDLWLPLVLQPALLPTVDWLHDPTMRAWQILARSKPHVSLDQITAELNVLAGSWPQPDGKELKLGVRKATLFEVDYPEFKLVCAVLAAAVAMVLLIGCVNVVNLIAARNTARRHEFAMRQALGAGRYRLIRQLCTESILIGLMGGAGGLALSCWSCNLLGAWLGGVTQKISGGARSVSIDLTPDWHVLTYAVVVSLLTGIVVGIWPAFRATRASLDSQLKSASEMGPIGGGQRQRNPLLAIQVGACLVLLVSAGLLFRGASHALTTDPGFDAKHIFVMWVNPATTAPTVAGHVALLQRVDARISELPEVISVTWAERAPFLGHRISSFESDEGRFVNGCVINRGTFTYFQTLGLTVVKGRTFTRQEETASAPVVVISESAANHLWPGKEPLGRRIFYPKPNRDGRRDSLVVIGVVKDARVTLLSQTDAVDLFVPSPISEGGVFLVRTRTAPEAAFQSTLATLRGIDPTLPSQALVMSMENGPMQFQRLWAMAPAVFATFVGGIALLLASVGLYGVISYVVARRTREIGVRIALGAQRIDIVSLVLRQTLTPVAWGAGFGLAGALAISVLLARLVLDPEIPDLTYGAGAFPSATLAGALTLLVGVILGAAIIPARRAAKVDPMVALRCE